MTPGPSAANASTTDTPTRGSGRPNTVAVIPAHDESATVGAVVRRALIHVNVAIVVDDGSTDGTAETARAAGAVVLRLWPNRGKGEALAEGLAAACALGAAFVVTLDADGEHEPEEIPALVAALAGADVALGHRRAFRSPARRALNAAARCSFRLLDPAIRDTICGFRAFRAEVVPLLRSDCGGFVYEHDVLLRAIAARLRLASVAVSTAPRRRSHVTAGEMLRAATHFAGWVLPRLGALPIPGWRKLLLALGCSAGLALGAPTAWLLGARRGTRAR